MAGSIKEGGAEGIRWDVHGGMTGERLLWDEANAIFLVAMSLMLGLLVPLVGCAVAMQ